MRALDDFIDEIKTLPPAPKVLPQLLLRLNDHNAEASQIVDLIAVDPALTAKVLQSVNNAAAGVSGQTADLHEAVGKMGFNAIYRLVAIVIGQGLLGAEQRGYGLSAGQLWEHSVTTALAARVIARDVDGDANLAFTAGLLHDIGKLVLSSFLTDCAVAAEKIEGPSATSFLEAEVSIFGAQHAEIGGRLLTRWNFPPGLVAAVTHHHDPIKAKPYEQLAAYVHLGDIISHCLGRAQGFASFAVEAKADALRILGLSPGEIDLLVLKVDDELNEHGGLIPTTT